MSQRIELGAVVVRDSRLWLVVMCADPDLDPAGSSGDVVVGSGNGMVLFIQAYQFASALALQNALRARAGLPPLPEPRTVTHAAPAVAVPSPDGSP